MTGTEVRQLRPRGDAGMPETLFAALARFQADLPRIIKGSHADVPGKEGKRGFGYDYADLADVSNTVLREIGKLGLFFSAWPCHREEDGKFGLFFTLGHVSGERQDGWWELRSDLPMQQIGGMITYARRYCLLAVTGAAPDGEDDDAASSKDVPSRQQSAGDAFENAAPARAQQDASVARNLLAAANSVATQAGSDQITRDSADAHKQGLITREQNDRIQNTARARLDALRAKARPVNVEDLADSAAQDASPAASAALVPQREAAQETPAPIAPPAAGEAPGSERHKKLVGACQGHFKRLLGYTGDETDEQRAERLWMAAKLAGVAEIASLSDLDTGELSIVAGALATCKDRQRLEEILAAAGST